MGLVAKISVFSCCLFGNLGGLERYGRLCVWRCCQSIEMSADERRQTEEVDSRVGEERRGSIASYS